MNILLISPKYSSYIKIKDTVSLNKTKLTLVYLAALTPKEHNVKILDEDIDDYIIDKTIDLVGINVNSVNAARAYEICNDYKKNGINVVLGGFHVSMFPDEALINADAVIIGEAEGIWGNLLNDLKNNRLKRIYKRDTPFNLQGLPLPRYDLYNKKMNYNDFPIFLTRGCPYNCSFCCIKEVYGNAFRKRPIDEVVSQIRYIKNNYSNDNPIPLSISFIDDNIWGDEKYAMTLFNKLMDLDISWYTLGASIKTNPKLIEAAAKSGCSLVFVGFESLYKENLKYLNKNQNDLLKYKDFIYLLHSNNIAIGAYFIVGLPYDKLELFDELILFLEDNLIEYPMIMIYNIIPGTKSYSELGLKISDYENMINNLPYYLPENMNKKQFRREFVELYKKIFSNQSINKRLKYCNNIVIKHINNKLQKYYNLKEWDNWVDAVDFN